MNNYIPTNWTEHMEKIPRKIQPTRLNHEEINRKSEQAIMSEETASI